MHSKRCGNTCTRCNATVGRKIILDRLEIARGKGSIIRGIERKASIFEGNRVTPRSILSDFKLVIT